jgi:hypothetical protein
MNRPSLLLLSDARTELRNSQSSDGDSLYRSNHGVPVAWIFAFGGRNIWNPGDDVEARGGVVGQRNPYETMVEVALARLEQAEGALQADPYLWPFLSPVIIMRRKLLTKSKGAFIRVAAPWVIGLQEQQIERWKAATAFAENAVNLVGAGRVPEGVQALQELAPFCPFVPKAHSGDRAALQSLVPYADQPEPLKLALAVLGEPDNRATFEQAVAREVAPGLDAYGKLPHRAPLKAPVAVVSASGKSAPATTSASGGGGLMAKLGGLFKRKG